MKKIIILAVLFCSTLFSEQYLFIFDARMSPICGAEILYTVHKGLTDAEDHFTKDLSHSCCPWLYSTGRLGEMLLIWGPLNLTMSAIEHEVFGHGYRIRDIGRDLVKVSHYSFDPPFPYGSSGATTAYSSTEPLTSFEEMAIAVAGTEANAIFGRRIKMHWLQNRQVEPKTSSLYVWSAQDLTIYSLLTRNKLNMSHDIQCYKYWLSLTYGRFLSAKTIKRAALVNLTDTTTYNALWAWWYYVFTGKSASMWLIPMGSYYYLPSARMSLAPYGPEFYWDNYLVKDDSPIYFYARFGSWAYNRYCGAGLEWPRVFGKNGFDIGLRLDAYWQPKMLFKSSPYLDEDEDVYYGYSKKDLSKHIPGLLCALIIEKKWGNLPALYVQAGWKSNGFIPGESLKKAPILKLGFSARF